MSEIGSWARQHRRWIIGAAAIVLFVLLYIDDWGRDLVQYEARVHAGAEDVALRPVVTNRPGWQMVEATKMAGRRIANWEYVGVTSDGSTTLVSFVRTHRLLRVKDDVTIRVEDRGKGSVVTGESRARLHLGDLGRNPRNLRRFIAELKIVLDGSVPGWLLDRGRAAAMVAPTR